MLESSGRWVAYLRLEDPPGLTPITTVGRFVTVEEAQVATDEVWAARIALCTAALPRHALGASGPTPGHSTNPNREAFEARPLG
jgi:hypothetical protein